MDFRIHAKPSATQIPLPVSAIILACKSDPYFKNYFAPQTHKLLTTTGFMAPEAYTLEAALNQWFSGKPPEAVHLEAAKAYAHYQKANINWAKKLFVFRSL